MLHLKNSETLPKKQMFDSRPAYMSLKILINLTCIPSFVNLNHNIVWGTYTVESCLKINKHYIASASFFTDIFLYQRLKDKHLIYRAVAPSEACLLFVYLPLGLSRTILQVCCSVIWWKSYYRHWAMKFHDNLLDQICYPFREWGKSLLSLTLLNNFPYQISD